jgi:hypothetical protein
VNEALEALVRSQQLERVQIGEPEAMRDLSAATKHLQSAHQIYLTDPAGAFQLAYDAARKCLQGLLALEGLRVRNPPRGNHYTFVLVGQSGLVDVEVWRPLNWMRELRNQTEYLERDSLPASLEDTQQALLFVAIMLEETKGLFPRI